MSSWYRVVVDVVVLTLQAVLAMTADGSHRTQAVAVATDGSLRIRAVAATRGILLTRAVVIRGTLLTRAVATLGTLRTRDKFSCKRVIAHISRVYAADICGRIGNASFESRDSHVCAPASKCFKLVLYML